jgi:hypothetical protein
MGQLQIRNPELVDLLSADFINCWIPIEQVVLQETVSFVMFEDIPQDFRALVLSGQIRTSRDAEQDVLRVRFNESSSNYDYIHVDFFCTNVTDTDCGQAVSSIQAGLCEGASSMCDVYSPFAFRLPGYARTDRRKWLVLLQGGRIGSLERWLRISLSRGLWENLEPVTSVMVYPGIGPNFVPNCIFELYGVL